MVSMKTKRRRAFGRIVKWQGRHCARWIEDGRLRQQSFRGSKALAQRFLAQKQLEIEERGAARENPIVRIRFEDLLAQHEAIWKGQKAASTILRERYYLTSKALPFFKGRWVDEVSRPDVERWLIERVKVDEISGATRSRLLNMISAYFRQAVALGHARANPAVGIRRQKEMLKAVPYLDVAAQERVIASTEGDLRLLVTILLDTGVRLGEALRIRWSDADFDRRVIVVRRSKNYTAREVPFTSRGQAALVAARNRSGKTPDGEDLVLDGMGRLDEAGEPKLCYPHRDVWLKCRKKAGFPRLTLHDLRHVFAVTAVRAGVPLGELREILGHKSLAMVLRYARHCPANISVQVGQRMEGFLASARPTATEGVALPEPGTAAAQ
jgi:integrase